MLQRRCTIEQKAIEAQEELRRTMLGSQLTSAMEEAKTSSDEVRQASRRQTTVKPGWYSRSTGNCICVIMMGLIGRLNNP
jgi:hypothetical protein